MDMNWIDEIRDPEPRKRYIYNADDYDPQYGDPYYREHDSPFKDCKIDHIWDENGILKMRGHHHDGSVEVEIRQDCPCDAPALVDLWKHRLRSRYAESSAD